MIPEDRTQMVLRDGTVVPSPASGDDHSAGRVSRMRLFHGITLPEIEPIVKRCQLKRYADEEVILKEGERNDAIFVVLSGMVRIEVGDRELRSTYLIGDGECFGEMSLVDEQAASARVVAASDANLLRVPAEVFWSDMVRVGGVAKNLFATMASRLRSANEATLRNLRRRLQLDQLRTEMLAARDIQAGMIPARGELFADRADVRCAGAMIPALDTAGDFFDAFAVDDHRVFFAVGDVSGKGFAAALFMARTMPLLRVEFLRRQSVARTLEAVNDVLSQNNPSCMFVTVGCGVLDARSGEVRYANAGHLPPLVLRAGAAAEVREVPSGVVVGALEGVAYEESTISLGPGETLLLYSDGVTEAYDGKGALYGRDRLVGCASAAAGFAPTEIVDRVAADVGMHAGGTPQSDDITLLAVRRQ